MCDFLIDIVFPIKCLECGKEKFWLCQECYNKLKLAESQKCIVCKRKNELGTTCKNHKKYLNGVWAAGEYKNKTLHKLIKTFKYNFIKELKNPLGKFLLTFFTNFLNKQLPLLNSSHAVLKNSNTIVIPVPLHKKKLRWREFNQAELIAEKICQHLNLELNLNNLIRIKYTKPQAKIKKEKRKENIKNSFKWNGNSLKDFSIILVDDVATSGSTLEECAKVLKESGANEVWGLVIARR